jgi:hypothetical protein
MSSSLIRKWRRWLDRIYWEQLAPLLISQHIFHQMNECLEPYIGSEQGADLARWMTHNYMANAITSIRRMMERPRAQWTSISLRILLEDLATNHGVLTLDRYRRLYRDPRVRESADQDFAGIVRNKKADHLSRSRIERDFRALEQLCKPAIRRANKVIAHTERDRRRIGRLRFEQVDAAIDALAETFRRYALLLNGSVSTPLVPFEAYDVRGEFQAIWPP